MSRGDERADASSAREREDRRFRVEAMIARKMAHPNERVVSERELEDLIEMVRDAGWDPRDYTSGERYHFHQHVELEREWPQGTSLQEYNESIRRLIEDPQTDVALSRHQGYLRVTFHGPTLASERGQAGQPYMVVEYSVERGYWATAFQTEEEVDTFFERGRRSEVVWL